MKKKSNYKIIAEYLAFKRLITEIYPVGVVSVVSDTFDLFEVCTEVLPRLKDTILARDGKVVIRPDSGDPVDIICGKNSRSAFTSTGISLELVQKQGGQISEPEWKGVIELLWETFGGTVNSKGYKQLDPHIGAIYGDSITPERAEQICQRLAAKGFASTNVVFGIGSYTYQYNTRDTFGMAMKATYVEVEETFLTAEGTEHGVRTVGREIFKDPVTDNGEKKSARGLLKVLRSDKGLELVDRVTYNESVYDSELIPVFCNGELIKEYSLSEIRKLTRQ